MAAMDFLEARTNVARLMDGASPILEESIWMVLVYADAWSTFCEDWEWEDDDDD